MEETLINLVMIMLWGLLLLFTATPGVVGFVPPLQNVGGFQRDVTSVVAPTPPLPRPLATLLFQSTDAPQGEEEEDEEKKEENPYADPNYPDLEFVNYDDPEYQVDQGVGDEFFDEDSTEAQIEEMREDRRRRNDEFQFQTYFKELLNEGREYKGEWSVYQTSTFMKDLQDKAVDANGFPRVIKSSRPMYVTSKAFKSTVETTSEFPTDAERINHVETLVENKEGSDDDDDDEVTSQAEVELNQSILDTIYWPKELSAFDFRGEKGIMCVGAAYTICTCVALAGDQEDGTEGPYSEYRSEVGLVSKDIRMRVKLDYRMKDEEKEAYTQSSSEDAIPPALCLKSMVVCREALERWPPGPDDDYTSATEQAISNAFYGKPGAEGGLYDPPPVGSEEQAGKYMLLDLEGGATILFPYEMEQDPTAFKGNGWVTSLDWTPGAYRFQVDRKVLGGPELRHLRTLELSEVQGTDADQYRPRDGGADMRQ